jgi:hypothetical protein
MRNVLDKSCRKNKKKQTFVINFFFFFENRTAYEIVSKNLVETVEPQMTSQCGTYALYAGLEKLCARMRMPPPTRSGTHMHGLKHAQACTHAHTPIINTYCFSTAKMVSWTRLNVTLYVHCLSCFFLALVRKPRITNTLQVCGSHVLLEWAGNYWVTCASYVRWITKLDII